jgi:hypothetical protein
MAPPIFLATPSAALAVSLATSETVPAIPAAASLTLAGTEALAPPPTVPETPAVPSTGSTVTVPLPEEPALPTPLEPLVAPPTEILVVPPLSIVMLTIGLSPSFYYSRSGISAAFVLLRLMVVLASMAGAVTSFFDKSL